MAGTTGWARTACRSTATIAASLTFPQAYVDATAAELIRRHDWLAARGIALRRRDRAGEVHDLSGAPARVGGAIAAAVAATIAWSPRWRIPAVALIDLRPASARGKGARSRLLPDRFALELSTAPWSATRRSCAKCSVRCRPVGLPTLCRRSDPPIVPGVDFYSGDLRRHARLAAAAFARTTSRRSRKILGRRDEPLRASATTPRRGPRASKSTTATGPACRAPSSIAIRWRSR